MGGLVRAVFQAPTPVGEGLVPVQFQVCPEGVGDAGGRARPLGAGVHEHVGDLAPEVYLTVGRDGLELHQLQVGWGQLHLEEEGGQEGGGER